MYSIYWYMMKGSNVLQTAVYICIYIVANSSVQVLYGPEFLLVTPFTTMIVIDSWKEHQRGCQDENDAKVLFVCLFVCLSNSKMEQEHVFGVISIFQHGFRLFVYSVSELNHQTDVTLLWEHFSVSGVGQLIQFLGFELLWV